MDTQLQEIIEKIHDEGVKGAEERAHAIIENAEKRAQARIDEATRRAESIVKEAEQEAARTRASGEAALQQAARDLLLALQGNLTDLFTTVQQETVAESLSADRMAEIIAKLVETWASSADDSLEVLVAESDRAALESALKGKLAAKVAAGVTVRPVRGITAGFRIGSKEGAAFYDVTDGTLADLLSAYLNPRLAELLKNAGAE